MLHAKFDGCCAFCGFALGERWHIWDIEPSKTQVNYRGEIILGNESYENKLPACVSCNSTRIHGTQHLNFVGDTGRKITIEQFREFLYHEFDFMKNYSMTSTYYKKMIKYGLIKETGNDIIFYFEKH